MNRSMHFMRLLFTVAPVIGGIVIVILTAALCTYRWLVDSRDDAKDERLDEMGFFSIYRCHTIDCTNTRPKA